MQAGEAGSVGATLDRPAPGGEPLLSVETLPARTPRNTVALTTSSSRRLPETSPGVNCPIGVRSDNEKTLQVLATSGAARLTHALNWHTQCLKDGLLTQDS